MKIEKIRKTNIIFSKNGQGYTTTKIVLPVPFVKALGLTENDRSAIIELKKDKIIIKKQNQKDEINNNTEKNNSKN